MSSTTSPAAPDVATAVRLLALATFLSGAALRICDGLIPRLARDFAITPGQAGGVVISFSIAYGLMQLVFGPLGDRYGKARMVSFAIAGCALGATACALAPSFGSLVAIRVVWGMAAAGIVPLAMAWIGDAVPFDQRQPTLAKLLGGTLSGMMAGQLAGGLFADAAAGWRGGFAALAVGYVLVTVLLFRKLPWTTPATPAEGHPSYLRQLRTVLGERWSWAVLSATLVEGVFLLGPMAYMPAYLHERFGLTVASASAMLALYAVGGLVYAACTRHLVTRLGQVRMVAAGGVLMGVGYLAWLLSPTAWTAAPVALLMGFGTYLFHNTLQTHATQMAPSARGTAVALFAFCLFFGQAIGATLAGQAFDHLGPAVPMLAAAVVLPLTGWAFARTLRRRLK
ncbi:MAG TPA: MFS transporter [Ramlibacter sp.]|nr:MFS transporter [Ramlibacter sp.]